MPPESADQIQSWNLDTIEYTREPGVAVRSDILREGLATWQALCAGREMPAPTDIDPLCLPPQILPHVALIDIEREPALRFLWRLIGTHITTMVGRDVTAKYWDEIYDAVTMEAISGGPKWVMEHRRPLRSLGSAAHVDKSFLNTESIDMPLSTDGLSVDRVFVLTVFSEG